MAPVETPAELSLVPLITLGFHTFLVLCLTALVANGIFSSYVTLPPSQATRGRELMRAYHVKVFSALAAVSLLCAVYWRCGFATLSYRDWANERGIALPEGIFDHKEAVGGAGLLGQLHLAQWLSDTSVYQEALEIVVENAGRAWWGEQLGLAAVAWGMLLAIEGRRRRIPHLWAYMTLAHAVSLSFAQNLFYIAILLAPVPLPDNVEDLTILPVTATTTNFLNFMERTPLSKPYNWCPHPILYLVPLTVSFTTIILFPFTAHTPSFMTVALVYRGVSFAPLVLPYMVPESWGTVHTHPHNTFSAYTALFKAISIVSIILHGTSTVLAFFPNTLDSYYYRHSLLYPFKRERRIVSERSLTAIGKVLGAIGDHPAVGAVGWDVLISGLSVGVWAASRGLDVRAILSSSGLPFDVKPKAAMEAATDIKSMAEEIEDITEKSIERHDTAPTPGKRRPGRPKKTEHLGNQEESPTSVPRRRKRLRKITGGDINYQPTEVVQEVGDEEQVEDWEAAALSWGLIAMTGLGTGCSAVFGAETTAR